MLEHQAGSSACHLATTVAGHPYSKETHTVLSTSCDALKLCSFQTAEERVSQWMSTAGFRWCSHWPVMKVMGAISSTTFLKRLLSTWTYFDVIETVCSFSGTFCSWGHQWEQLQQMLGWPATSSGHLPILNMPLEYLWELLWPSTRALSLAIGLLG